MTEEKKIENNQIPLLETRTDSEVSKDSVISGDKGLDHLKRLFEAKSGENQDSPSDMSLRALSPNDPEYDKLKSNRFEIVSDENPQSIPMREMLQGELRPTFDYAPLIVRENDVSLEFYQKVIDTWNALPETERNSIKAAGVTILCKESVKGQEGSEAAYFAAFGSDKPRIEIGMYGVDSFGGGAAMMNENRDVSGSVKHEVGHAFFDILKPNERQLFSELFNAELSALPKDFVEKDPQWKNRAHIFAECYATIRGRQSDRVEKVKKYFPSSLSYVEKLFEKK